jgi:mono/diheme cytochrome c family protein
MTFRLLIPTLGLVALILAHAPGTLHAAPSNVSARGKAILQDKCGRCHAVEATGRSPLAQAPPFRNIYARHSPRDLQERFSEGLASRHKDMPQIPFSDEDVHAILTYLYTLAIGK